MKWKGEGQCLLGFRFCFRGGADNGRIVRGQREGHEEWTARRTTGGADSYDLVKKKIYDFFLSHN